MIVRIFNWREFIKYSDSVTLSKDSFTDIIQSTFSGYNISELSIIFVDEEYILNLNKEFRGITSVTDVLSFNIDTEPLVGEVYICPKFVNSTFKKEKYFEEIIRDTVHGILHICGFDHKGKFISKNISNEEMFVKQEDILQNIINEINSRSG